MENESIDSLPFSPLPSPTINKLHELRVKAAAEALAQSLFNLSKHKKNQDENQDEYWNNFWNNYYSDSFESLSSDYDRKYKDDSDSFESLSSDEGNKYTSSYISPDDWNKIEMYKSRNNLFKPKPPTMAFRPIGKFVRAAQYLKRGRPVNKEGDPVKREEFSNIGGSSSKKTKTKKTRTKKTRTKK